MVGGYPESNGYQLFDVGNCMRSSLTPGLDVINVSSGQCWNSIHMNPVKGVIPTSSASRDFKGGFKVELAQGVTRQMTKLMEEVGAKSVFGPVMDDIWARAAESLLCKDQESRSIWRLFVEEDGKLLGKVKVE
jgi:3-hydroxyisobutyrate dehydrogenase